MENDKIILDMGYNGKGICTCLLLVGDASRSRGMLRFSHEFTVALGTKDLHFMHAESIDCGETSEYYWEPDFSRNFPGVMASLREANEQNRLYVRVYAWNEAKGVNEPTLAPYAEWLNEQNAQ